MFKWMVLLCCFIFSCVAYANPEVQITRLMIDKTHGNKLFIKTNTNVVESPPCSTNGVWQYVFMIDSSDESKVLVSFLLSAHVGKMDVILFGTGECDVYSSIETLRRVELQ